MRILRLFSVVFLVSVVTLSGTADASPFDIRVLDSNYTTWLRTNGIERQTVSSEPWSDAIVTPVPFFPPRPMITEAVTTASADTFNIAVQAMSVPWHPIGSWAMAQTVLDFSPIASGIATIGLTANTFCLWTQGSVSLSNLSSNTTLFNFGWDCMNPQEPSSATPWNGSPLDLALALNSGERYRLTLYAAASSQHEGELTPSARVTGLRVVPEPPLLLLCAIAALIGARSSVTRKRARRT